MAAKKESALTVPVYRLPYGASDIAFVQRHVARVLKRGYLTDGGEYVAAFEAEFAAWLGRGQALAVNSATTALELILKAIDVRGHSVLVPTYTFYATPLAVANAGGQVLFADIDRATLALSLASLKKQVRPDTKAVVLVHVAGVITPAVTAIRSWCHSRGLILIEDAACAHGATLRGRRAGTLGDIAAFSFHHSKVLTTGEGGMVVTRRREWLESTRVRRAIGVDRRRNNWEVLVPDGNNYKMHEITAVLGLLHVRRADRILAERRRLARYYDTHINFNDHVQPFAVPKGTKSAYYKYLLRVKEPALKEVIRTQLRDHYKVMLPPNVYDHLCHDQAVTAQLPVLNAHAAFPESEYMRDHHVCLPMYNGLTSEERKHVVTSLNHVIARL
jgi:perosamine synthetase